MSPYSMLSRVLSEYALKRSLMALIVTACWLILVTRNCKIKYVKVKMPPSSPTRAIGSN